MPKYGFQDQPLAPLLKPDLWSEFDATRAEITFAAATYSARRAPQR